MERARKFIKRITKENKVCILHDTDPDGICAAVILAKCVQKLRGKPIDLRLSLQRRKIAETTITTLQRDKITHLIIADFSADQFPDELRIIAKTCKVLIVDHHTLYNEIKHDGIVLCKPQLITKTDPSQYCTAKLSYDITKEITNIETADWLAAVGCIADMAVKPWQEWLDRVFSKYNVGKKSDLFETTIGKVASIIVNTEVYDKKLVNTCYEYLYEAQTPQQIVNSQLMKYKKIIDDELNKHIKSFPEKAIKHGELWMYEISSKYEIQGPLGTLLCLRYPNITIIIINSNSQVKVSARRYDQKVHVDRMITSATKTFKEANAGGYKHSAGARFDKKNLEEFKKKVIKWQM